MEGLVSLLVFAGLFYVMMRFGCGSHAVHGHGGRGHGEHGEHGAHGHGSVVQADTPAADPVCGMRVQPNDGYTKTHDGRAYRFCSRACLDTFEANPGRYASAQGGVP